MEQGKQEITVPTADLKSARPTTLKRRVPIQVSE